MKKIYTIFALLLFSYTGNAQLKEWYGSIGKACLQFDHVTMSNGIGTVEARYRGTVGNDIPANADIYSLDYRYNRASFNHNFFNLNAEAIGKHTYVDFTNIAYLMKEILGSKKDNIKGNRPGKGVNADILGFKLAFGGPFSERVAFYAGAQWSFSELSTRNNYVTSWSVEQQGPDTVLSIVRYGVGERANYRGPSMHLLIDGEKTFYRISASYDFIRKKHTDDNYNGDKATHYDDFRGSRIGGEIMALYQIADRYSLMFVGGFYQVVMDERVVPSLITSSTDNLAGYTPRIVANDLKFQIGIAYHTSH